MSMMINMFALAASGSGVSGGDRIFIEFARRWAKKVAVRVIVSEQGLAMCHRMGLNSRPGIKFGIVNIGFFAKVGFLVDYVCRIVASIGYAIVLGIKHDDPKMRQVNYSASEFWMDSLPCLILKLLDPRSIWVAAWYQTAPSPWQGFAEVDRRNTYRIKALVYWLVQLPIKPLISRYADLILVNNEGERSQFVAKGRSGRVAVVIGAVNLTEIHKYIKTHPKVKKKFDAVFQGRFHPQKGVVELVEIWKKVVEVRSNARLAMIGDGPLMDDVRVMVNKLKLGDNIKLFGYVFDGLKKYRIFSESSLVVHPAYYDSGGMAAAEAMAFGLPAVAFNLKSYESYYPIGVVKVNIGSQIMFAKSILKLLDDRVFYKKYQRQANMLIRDKWDWDVRAAEIFEKVRNLTEHEPKNIIS